MYDQSQNVIKEGYDKSLKLDEVPGLLSFNKVKPKDIAKNNTRVTNVYGSMEGQNILQQVSQIKEEKQKTLALTRKKRW